MLFIALKSFDHVKAVSCIFFLLPKTEQIHLLLPRSDCLCSYKKDEVRHVGVVVHVHSALEAMVLIVVKWLKSYR